VLERLRRQQSGHLRLHRDITSAFSIPAPSSLRYNIRQNTMDLACKPLRRSMYTYRIDSQRNIISNSQMHAYFVAERRRLHILVNCEVEYNYDPSGDKPQDFRHPRDDRMTFSARLWLVTVIISHYFISVWSSSNAVSLSNKMLTHIPRSNEIRRLRSGFSTAN